ncbi:MAG: hypothetical protein HPY75_11650 [Actinobacteria bacterium]|nr:hypothetical protein [Actinomycetota bacterium]
MKMKRMKRILIILVAMGLVASIAMAIPASAKSGSGNVRVLDSEFVLCTMGSTGEIEEVQVFNFLGLNGDGTVTVKEEKAFDEVGGFQGVKSFAKPKVEGDYIVWPEISVSGNKNVVANTKLSEAMVEEARTRIPLDVKVKYWFDGEPVTDLETITGKSGRFKLEMTLKNTSKEKREVEYEDPATGEMKKEEVDVYLPLVILPYDWYFDNSTFFNLECDETGIIVPMPDFYNVGWSIPLFPPATEESHTIWVAADVKNFKMPPLTLSVNFVFPHTNQSNPLELLGPAIKQVYEGVKQLNQGVGAPDKADTLLYGITAVDGGLQQLAAGLPEAKYNLDAKLIPGVSQAAAGIGSASTPNTLLYADAAAIAGLQGIKAGIGSETTEQTLLYAANAIHTNLQAISGALGDATQSQSIIGGIYAVLLGLSNPDPAQLDVLKGLKQISSAIGTTSTPDTLLQGAQELANNTDPANPAGLYAAIYGVWRSLTLEPGTNSTLRDYVNKLPEPDRTIARTMIDGVDGPPPVLGLADYLQLAYGGVNTIHTNITRVDPTFVDPGLIQALQALKGGADTMIDKIEDLMVPGLTQIYGGLTQIKNGIGNAPTDENTLLYAIAAIESGLNSIKGGIGDMTVDGTLLYALAAMQNGLTQLKAGLSSGNINSPGVKEGLMLISAGIGDAIAGLGSHGTPDTLLYGSGKVTEGLTQVGEGTSKLEEGLTTMVSSLNMSAAELEAIEQRGHEFDHFLGRAKDAENQVRFVYQSKPTYNYVNGSKSSWIVAIVLSILIALGLVGGGILLSRKGTA